MNIDPPFQMPPRRPDAHKGMFGRALLVGGSRGMCGSIAMSSVAALRVGAGLVTAAVPDRCLESVASFHPCIMTQPMSDEGSGHFSVDAATELASMVPGVSAVGCGPGMTTHAGSVRIVERLLNMGSIPRLVDADAINVLPTFDWIRQLRGPAPLVMTPHPGELVRIAGTTRADREGQINAAKRLADECGAVIVVKGGPSVVVSREHDAWINTTGNPGMATAGSGDVLTGVITSLLAQGISAWAASCLGVWVHGLAGDLAAQKYGQAGMTAAEILEALPDAIALVVESA